MIADFFLSAFFGGINALVSLFPTYSFPSPTAGTGFFNILSGAQRVFPVAAVVVCLGAQVTVRAALTGWDFLVWIYHQFWGSD